MNMAQTDVENKNGAAVLHQVQVEFSKVDNLIAAMRIIVDDVDEPVKGRRRQKFDALIGVCEAMADQMERAWVLYEQLFPLFREGRAK